ncbi:hypothetical protein FB382_001861 [Nocardioides ginsengisegetis]|uniref:Uncharacterized protein n=1 Tax=Nocardioides ginsengisegetis TaxID=661491 RepID=A0A7W3IZR8_9ACTN|nr:hypothetical protein [Nocardioides ginsengisegetis]MBA8803570.1 hypothetical protein [Nocardioides ginsengisegetis]
MDMSHAETIEMVRDVFGCVQLNDESTNLDIADALIAAGLVLRAAQEAVSSL